MTDLSIERRNGVSSADWWKFTATGLAGVVVTVVTGYLSGLGDLVTRPQVREMIQSDSPYTHDRALIHERLDATRAESARLSGKFDAILEGQNRMSGQLIQLTEQVSQLRDRERERPRTVTTPIPAK